MIDDKPIRLAIRQRIVSSTGLNPDTDIKFENIKFDPKGKSYWIAEYITSGDETRVSNARSRIRPFIVQYNVYVPLNKGTNKLDEIVTAIESAFDINDNSKCFFDTESCDVQCFSSRIVVDQEESWYVNKIVLQFDVVQK